MIKIIKDAPKEYTATCPRCGCYFSYELKDISKLNVYPEVKCPHCGTYCQHIIPNSQLEGRSFNCDPGFYVESLPCDLEPTKDSTGDPYRIDPSSWTTTSASTTNELVEVHVDKAPSAVEYINTTEPQFIERLGPELFYDDDGQLWKEIKDADGHVRYEKYI